MRYAIRKRTYGGGQAYRYYVHHIVGDGDNSDEESRNKGQCEHLRYIVELPALLVPSPIHPIRLLDTKQRLAGRICPDQSLEWRDLAVGRYQTQIFTGEESDVPLAVIRILRQPVDLLLLRLPCYEITLGRYRYLAQGNRHTYGVDFYEIFRLQAEEEARPLIPELPVDESAPLPPPRPRAGRIERPPVGPNYIIEANAAPLRQSPLTLVSLVILLDMTVTADDFR